VKNSVETSVKTSVDFGNMFYQFYSFRAYFVYTRLLLNLGMALVPGVIAPFCKSKSSLP
jgi:hypothetical protein